MSSCFARHLPAPRALIVALCFLAFAPGSRSAAHAQGYGPGTEQEWRFVLTTLDNYRRQTATNPNAVIFSNLIYNVARTAYQNRVEAGGWASDLVRGSLVYTATDINDHYTSWFGPDQSRLVSLCTSILTRLNIGQALLEGLASDATDVTVRALERAGETVLVCQGAGKGDRHFERHLEPFLFAYMRAAVREAVARAPLPSRVEAASERIIALCREHRAFLSYAVIPGFNRIPGMGETMRDGARAKTVRDARGLRRDAVEYALDGAREREELSAADAETVQRRTRRACQS